MTGAIARSRLSNLLPFLLVVLTAYAPANASPSTARVDPPARHLPPPEEIALPHERATFNELLSRLVTIHGQPREALSAMDAALSKLTEPTKLRGFIQLGRAELLMDLGEVPKATAAIEDSIRLLPGYSGPLIGAAMYFAYANQPAKAADYFLRAAQSDPATVRQVDDYEVNNLLRRLSVARDERRADAISERLLEIGWTGSKLQSLSTLARRAIERRLRAGDVEGARALIPKLLVPAHSYSLLTVNEFKPLWPDVERWAGRRLEQQWATYLNEARQRFAASKSPDTVHDYTRALLAAGHYDTVIKDALPIVSRKLDAVADYDLILVIRDVAHALAYRGRWNEAHAIFERAQKVWPLGSDANALNIAANQARYLMFAGRTAEGLLLMDKAIADARRWDVNRDAFAGMHHARACMLHQLGRGDEAGASIAIASSVQFASEIASLHLCTGNKDAAKRVLLEAMKNQSGRENVIAFMQKPDAEPFPVEYSRKLRARIVELTADPQLRAVVLEHGRILDFGESDGAPPELN
jgi:tetratricopeptide (TPR) repeat protein